ncbi:hypothetical protein CS8_051300 [Cupriavidus sp. 8B]
MTRARGVNLNRQPISKERVLVDARRSHLYRLACAVHVGFVRMTGRTLDACKQVPRFLWAYVGAQIGVTPPDMGTLGALYDGRTDTLVDHQMQAYQALELSPTAERQRRYVTLWLKGEGEERGEFELTEFARNLPHAGICQLPVVHRAYSRA